MKKISISIGRLQLNYGDKEALRIAKEIGADAVDFGLYRFSANSSVYSLPESEIFSYFSSLKAYADELGLEIGQTHGRISGYKNDIQEDALFRKDARLDCLATAALGAPVCVMHGVTTMFHMNAEPEFMRNLNFKQFNDTVPYAKEFGIKIATETFGDIHDGSRCDFFGMADEFVKTYERICNAGDNKNYMTVCLDTGHSNKATKFGNPSVPDLIRKLGSEITVLHLNDNDTTGDQHMIPFVYKGKFFPVNNTVDWDKTFDALDFIGYNGIYNMELELTRYGAEIVPDTAEFAIKVLRNFINNREKAD